MAKTSRDWDLRAVAPFVALLLLLILGTIANPNFISIDNLLNVATRSAFIAIIALGATYVISSGGLDLSVGAMVAFVASIMILFMNSGMIADPVLMLIAAVMLALVVGAACGLLNGIITTVGGIDPSLPRWAPWAFIAALPHGCRRAARSRCATRKSSRFIAQPISARCWACRCR
ncbi:predicted protein [Brucella sp. NVSL 07-0026]|nr:predicted protein [Brucella sp. NVSL 07-0026]